MKISNKQQQALNLLDDPTIGELLLGGSAGGAKTWVMCMMMVTLCRKYPGAKIFLGRKTLRSLKDSTLATLISKVHPFMGVLPSEYSLKNVDAKLIYNNGSQIIWMELDYHPNDPDFARFGSLEIDYAFLDEAGEITVQAKNAVKSRVGRGIMNSQYGIPGGIVLSCNPSRNFLRQEYYDPYVKLGGGGFQKWQIGTIDINGEEVPTYRAFLRISAYDNPFLPKSYIDTLNTLPDQERRRLLEGDWNYTDDDNVLFKNGLLDKATTYNPPEQTDKFEKYIGVDVADGGKDHTVFSLINNGVLITQKTSSVQMNWEKGSSLPLSRLMADELIEFAQKNGFTPKTARNIAVETNGVGVGIRDMLKDRGWAITEYTATHKSRSENYYQLMLDMDSGDIKIASDLLGLDDLKRELLAHTYEMRNQDPDVLKKAALKVMLGRSPDYADSFMIANYCRNQITNPQNDPTRNVNRLGI